MYAVYLFKRRGSSRNREVRKFELLGSELPDF